jgi:hypothetical protein
MISAIPSFAALKAMVVGSQIKRTLFDRSDSIGHGRDHLHLVLLAGKRPVKNSTNFDFVVDD